MSKGINHFIGAAVFGLALAASAPSFAVPITGTSGGTFTNLSGCGGGDCSITSSSHVLSWGSTSSQHNLRNPSTLTIDTFNINTATNSTNTVIAELTWFNSSTLDSQTPDDFSVHYNLSIHFTAPGNSTTTETFDLDIINTSNPTGDKIGSFTLPDLSALVFNLPGVTVSNLHYVADNHSTLTNNIWFNKENNTANLFIEADFSAVRPAPEPASLALMGAGLIGFGKLRRRMKR